MPFQSDPRDINETYVGRDSFERRLIGLKRRLVSEAATAINMLEAAIDGLWTLDRDALKEVRRRDDRIDREEVAIEEECFQIMQLQQPVARDFRVLTFVLKVNADLERVADHASGIAKAGMRMQGPPPQWPTSLVELGQRVPAMCHELLRAVLDEDVEAARRLLQADKTIDGLDKAVFDETVEFVSKEQDAIATGLLVYRVGRELERIGDLMTNIAEDLIYLATGDIVRHDYASYGLETKKSKDPPQRKTGS